MSGFNSFAEKILGASFNLEMADRASVRPKDDADPFEVRLYMIGPDEALDLGLISQPVTNWRRVEVLKSAWDRPAVGDHLDILNSEGVVALTLRIADEPMSLDDKRLVWSLNCSEVAL